jgi:hypothetical protein
MTWADVLYTDMLTDNFFLGVMQSYTNVLGGFFYLILMFTALTMIYIKTRDFGTTSIVGMLMSFMLAFISSQMNFPGLNVVFYAITVSFILGIAWILWKMFK